MILCNNNILHPGPAFFGKSLHLSAEESQLAGAKDETGTEYTVYLLTIDLEVIMSFPCWFL